MSSSLEENDKIKEPQRGEEEREELKASVNNDDMGDKEDAVNEAEECVDDSEEQEFEDEEEADEDVESGDCSEDELKLLKQDQDIPLEELRNRFYNEELPSSKKAKVEKGEQPLDSLE